MDHRSIASPELSRRASRHLEASSSTSSTSSSVSSRKKKKKKRSELRREQDDTDVIECSGRGCKSCTAGTVADCVAVCICPCAVVNFLALALVKVPWIVGKKCLGIGKSRQKKLEMRAKMMTFNPENVPVSPDLAEGRNGSNRRWRVGERMLDITMAMSAEEEEEERSVQMEAERVWMEMEQLGFGRVSFHGIQSMGRSSSRNV